MSGTLPTTIGPSSFSFSALQPALTSVAHSQARQVRSLDTHRWLFKVSWQNMLWAEYAPYYAFLLKQRGPYEKFHFTLPSPHSSPRGSWAGTPLVDGAVAVGTREIPMDGFTPSASNVALVGDFLKFDNHEKLYMVVENSNADGSGDATITIEPSLMTALPDNQSSTVSGITVQVRRPQNVLTAPDRRSLFFHLSMDLVEEPN